MQALRLPRRFVTYNKSVFPGDLFLLTLLRRLSYLSRLVDLSHLFGISVPELSLVFNATIDILNDTWNHLLDCLDASWITDARLQGFCQAIRNAESPYENIWGFLDGTVNRICRPVRHQRILYSRHKRVHCLKYQGVMTPCGIIANLFGPMEGRTHDIAMLEESQLLHQMAQHMGQQPNRPHQYDLVLFADQGYALHRFIQTSYRGNNLPQLEADFNRVMSGLRVTVEWGFGRIGSLFAFCKFEKNLKVLLSPVGKYYRCAVLLTNCHSCLRRNQVSKKFKVRPPQEYLQWRCSPYCHRSVAVQFV